MASRSMHLPFLVSLAIGLFFLQTTSARDMQFFSKITHENTIANTNGGGDQRKGNVNVQEGIVPRKEETSLTRTQVPEQGPGLQLPQSNGQNGYGLYGQETAVFPPSTASFDIYASNQLPLDRSDNYEEPLKKKNNKYMYNMETVGKGREEEGTTREEQGAYSLYDKAMHYYSNPAEYQGLSGTKEYMDRNADDLQRGNAYINYNLQQRQGMSDTRFAGNGRYYYDVNSDQKNGRSFGYSNYNSDEEDENGNNVVNMNGYFGNNENVNPYDQYDNIGMPYKNREEGEFKTFQP